MVISVLTKPFVAARFAARSFGAIPGFLLGRVQMFVEAFISELIGFGDVQCPPECFTVNNTGQGTTSLPPTPAAGPPWAYAATFATLILGSTTRDGVGGQQ